MIKRGLIVAIVAVSAAIGFAADSLASEISVADPWARATPPAAPTGAAFMILNNSGTTADRLIKVEGDVAEKVQMHTNIQDGDVMKMRQVDAIDVPASGMTELKPGGLHIMLVGLKAPLTEGESFPLTLTFESAGEMTVEVPVKAMGAMDGMDHGKMDKMH